MPAKKQIARHCFTKWYICKDHGSTLISRNSHKSWFSLVSWLLQCPSVQVPWATVITYSPTSSPRSCSPSVAASSGGELADILRWQDCNQAVSSPTGGLFVGLLVCFVWVFLTFFVLPSNATLYIVWAALSRKFFISSQKSSPAVPSYTDGTEPYSEHLLLLCLAAARMFPSDAFAKGSNSV